MEGGHVEKGIKVFVLCLARHSNPPSLSREQHYETIVNFLLPP